MANDFTLQTRCFIKILLQRHNGLGPASLLQQTPVFQQLVPMHFGLRFHQPLLSEREQSRNQIDGVQAVNRHGLLILGMEMRQVMRSERLRIHADDNPIKPRKFRHSWLNLGRTITACKCGVWHSRGFGIALLAMLNGPPSPGDGLRRGSSRSALRSERRLKAAGVEPGTQL